MDLVIDAHQHFWQLGREPFNYDWPQAPGHGPIFRDRPPDDLLPHFQPAAGARTVLVHTQHPPEEHRSALGLA